MTKKQSQVFEFIREHQSHTGGYPTYREIQEGVGIKNIHSVTQFIRFLARDGHLKLVPQRGYRLAGYNSHRQDNRYEVLGRAVMFACTAHAGAMRDGGDPYISHPMAVMNMMQGDSEDMTVAVLHDVVEDADFTCHEVQEIVGLSNELTHTLDCLSRRPGEPRDKYILRVCSDHRAMRIKLRDIEHNMSTLTPEIEHRRPRYLAEWSFIFTHVQLNLKKIYV